MPDVSAVSAVASGDRLHVFANGADGKLHHGFQDWAAPSFDTHWTTVTAAFDGAPAAVSWAPKRLDLIGWSGPEQGTVRHLWSRDDGQTWRDEVIGEGFVGAPAASSWGVDRLDVIGLGPGGYRHKSSNGNVWSPPGQEWTPLGNDGPDGFGIAAWRPAGRLGLDVVTLGGNEIHHRWNRDGQWNTPVSPGGSLWENLGDGFAILDPTPVTDPFRSPVANGRTSALDVFGYVHGPRAIFHKWSDGTTWFPSQTGWTDLGGNVSDAPRVTSWSPDRVDVAARTGGGGIGHRWFAGGEWNTGGWEDLSTADIRPVGAVSALVTRGPKRLDLLAVNDAGVWWRRFPSITNPNTWSGWVSVTVPG